VSSVDNSSKVYRCACPVKLAKATERKAAMWCVNISGPPICTIDVLRQDTALLYSCRARTDKGHKDVTTGPSMEVTQGKCRMISVMSKTKYPTDSPRAALET